MTPEQIIEIARRFANEKCRFQPFELNAATVYHTYWEFPEKDLLTFAQLVIEAERERIKQIVRDVTEGRSNCNLLLERIDR
jgi:hypothetical protein